MSINRVVLTGRLTKDVELRATPSGANVASFTVAVDGFGRDQNNNPVNQASFVNCVAGLPSGCENPRKIKISYFLRRFKVKTLKSWLSLQLGYSGLLLEAFCCVSS